MKRTLEEKVIKFLTTEKASIKEISKQFKLSQKESRQLISDLRSEGYRIKSDRSGKKRYYYVRLPDQQDEYIIISPKTKGVSERKWVAFSDTHIGCKAFDEKALRTVLETGIKRGYSHAYFSGDLVDGNNVYRGQNALLSHWSLEDQVSEALRVLADYNYDYYAIGGNHDYSWNKKGAPNPVDIVAANLENFTAIGEVKGDVVIEGMLMRLIHGAGGNAYAKSYPSQKYLRNLFEADSAHITIRQRKYPLQILQIGHYHTNSIFDAYGVKVIHPGAFQGPSEFTIRKGLEGPRGGYLIDVAIEDGELKEFLPRWIKG